jgi:hypothetical protein
MSHLILIQEAIHFTLAPVAQNWKTKTTHSETQNIEQCIYFVDVKLFFQ